ncbi:unnamed protein product [Orchesella dallaii]|uniref:Odorant receptor n=1 Tax=Orchesella dallaii TaxID=48710 RepID=A0ABP1RTB7_9HEXA
MYDESVQALVPNPNRFTWRKMVPWKFSKYFFTLITINAFFQLIIMYVRGTWKEKMVYMAVYSVVFAMSSFAWMTVWTEEYKTCEFSWVVSQQLTLYGVRKTRLPTLRTLRHLKRAEITAYIICIVFFSNPILYFVFPFVMDECPIQNLLSSVPPSVFPVIYRKILASGIYGVGVICGSIICMSFLLAFTASGETVRFLLLDLRPRLNSNSTNYNQFSKSLISSDFSRAFKLFRILHSTITLSNMNMYYYMPYLVLIGICFCISGFFTAFSLFGKVNILVYFFFVSVAVVVTLIICFLGSIGAEPREEFYIFRRLWRRRLVKKVERMELRSCFPFAYTAGPFLKYKKDTTIDILTTVVDYTIAFVIDL